MSRRSRRTPARRVSHQRHGGSKVTLQEFDRCRPQLTGKADLLKALGLTTASGGGNATVSATRTTSAASLGQLIQDGSTLNVNGHTITFKNAPDPGSPAPAIPTGSGISGNVVTDGNGNSTVYLQAGTVADVLNAIDLATGVQTASIARQRHCDAGDRHRPDHSSINTSGQLKISTGVNADLAITGTGNALTALGLAGTTGTANGLHGGPHLRLGGINGKTLTFASFNGGTAVNVTFGDGTNGTVKTLDQLNTPLQANNLTATVDANGQLTITASNDYASSTLGSTVAAVRSAAR